MNSFKSTVLLLSLFTAYQPAMADGHKPKDLKPLKQEAKQQIKAFATDLKSVLKQGMKASGPEGAVALCNTSAPNIAANHSKGEWTIARTSLKVRNANNQATERQNKILKQFEIRKTNGEKINTMAHAEVIGDTFYFTKAIPTAPICEKCHGNNINAKASSIINKLYPNDQAIGFKAGDIRGAFILSKKINTGK